MVVSFQTYLIGMIISIQRGKINYIHVMPPQRKGKKAGRQEGKKAEGKAEGRKAKRETGDRNTEGKGQRAKGKN